MGKTYRHQESRYDDDRRSERAGKHTKHSNNRKQGGMRILNDHQYEDDDYFDEDVDITDEIELNITRGPSRK